MFKNKSILSWAFYDWANSVFATVVIAGFFPIVFKSYWAADLSSSENTFWLAIGNALASFCLVCMAPFLGAIGDKYNCRKPLLLVFMSLGAVATTLLASAEQGSWMLALLLYVMATIGFMGANVFYDALLLSVSKPSQLDKVSGLGYGLGYLGGGISLAACVYFSQHPQVLGVESVIDAVLICFSFSAIWWFIFSLPLAFWVQDNKQKVAIKSSVFRQTIRAFKRVFSHRQSRLFLIAYWLYIDGVDTIIRMAVDYGMALGFETSDLIQALLITQFVGFPAAIAYGYLGQKIGVKNALLGGIGVYALITWLGYSLSSAADFYMLAVLIGLVQGGVQAMSRSLFSRMIPEGQAAEYFGIYNMLGKSAAILGPILMGGVTLVTGNHRYSMLSVLLLFVLGALILARVDVSSKHKVEV